MIGSNNLDPQFRKIMSGGELSQSNSPIDQALYQDRLISDLANLQRRSEKNDKSNFLVKTIRNIYNYFKSMNMNNVRFTAQYTNSVEYSQSILTQDHLAYQGASEVVCKSLFLNLLKDKTEPECIQFRNGISQMQGFCTSIQDHKEVAQKIVEKFKSLKTGEDMWLNVGISGDVPHAMKARIACEKDNQYVFYLCNTGYGIQENTDFHPVIIDQRTGKSMYQTVARSMPLTKKQLSKSFFLDLMRACFTGAYPSGYEESNEKKKNNIGAVYETLRKYIKMDEVAYSSHSPYWSRAQFGKSCVPNSYWHMAKTVLKDHQYKELRLNARVAFLKQNYEKIVKNYDRSSTTRKIALDLVQKLIWTIEKKGVVTPELRIFHKIREDLIHKTKGSESVEVMNIVRNRKKFGIQSIRDEIIDGKKIRISKVEVKAAAFYKKGLFQTLGYLDIKKDEKGLPVTIEIEHDEKGNPVGITSYAYQFYEALLSKDNKLMKLALKELEKIFSNSDVEAIKKEAGESHDLLLIANLLNDLTKSLHLIDFTKSGLLKQFSIISVARNLILMEMAKSKGSTPNFTQTAINVFIEYKNLEKLIHANSVNELAIPNDFWKTYLRQLRPFQYIECWSDLEKQVYDHLKKLRPDLNYF